MQVTKEERWIIEELGELQYSSLGGRIIHLLKKLDELPNLSQESFDRIKGFANHINKDVKAIAKKMLKERFEDI